MTDWKATTVALTAGVLLFCGVAQGQPYGLHHNTFEAFFTIDPPDGDPPFVFGARDRRYYSEQAILFWAFDKENPEALFKVLDGRGVNGYWWIDVAVLSDLHTQTEIWHRRSGKRWILRTGTWEHIFSGKRPANFDRRQTFSYAYPEGVDGCSVFALGPAVSLRDAFDSQGRIPEKHFR